MYFNYIKEFGIGRFAFNGITRIFAKFHLPMNKYTKIKHTAAQRYLYRNYSDCIGNDDIPITPEENAKKRIFVFWWDGESSAPETVKQCINSIRQNNSTETVVVDRYNLNEFITLPSYIIEKAENGKMGLAHFSDILRFALLYKYGGIWMDATCLQLSPTPQEVFDYPFYSIKGAFNSDKGLDWQWTSFYMAAHAGNDVCKKMTAFYFKYWQEHNEALTYLILDCWMTVLYNNDQSVKQQIDMLDKKDNSIFLLNEIANLPYDKKMAETIINKTFFQKVTYKVNYASEKDGELTNWGYFTKN